MAVNWTAIIVASIVILTVCAIAIVVVYYTVYKPANKPPDDVCNIINYTKCTPEQFEYAINNLCANSILVNAKTGDSDPLWSCEEYCDYFEGEYGRRPDNCPD
jgi:hypothetical protein